MGSNQGMYKGPEVEEKEMSPTDKGWSRVVETKGGAQDTRGTVGPRQGQGDLTGRQEAGPLGRASGPPRFSFILRAIGSH